MSKDEKTRSQHKLGYVMCGFALRYYADHPAEYVRDFGSVSVVRALSVWKTKVSMVRNRKVSDCEVDE